MLFDLIDSLLEALAGLSPTVLYLLTGVFTMLETTLGIGLLVPGDVIVLLAGSTVTSPSQFVVLVMAVTVGTLTGESLGYLLGRRFGPRVRASPLGRRLGEHRWAAAEGFLTSRGGRSIAAARFVAVVHAVLPVVAGTVRMRYRRFVGWCALGALSWSLLYVAAGWAAGASYRSYGERLGVAGYVLLGAVLLGALTIRILRRRGGGHHGVWSQPAARPTSPARLPPRDDSRKRPVTISPAPEPSLDTSIAARTVQLTKVYGRGAARVMALDAIDVEIPAGRLTAVMGPSGSGKSTLLHCLAGLDTPTSGQVYLGDTDLGRLTDNQLTRLRRDQAGFVFQDFNLIPTLSAAENITLPAVFGSREPDPRLLDAIVDTLELRHRLQHRPSQLSGGEQQRVACARALITRPRIVFADEPTGNLDSRSSAELLTFLRRSVEELGQTIVMVTHDPAGASYADQVLFLTDGRLAGELTTPTAERVLARMARLDCGRSSA
jgi:putative ABC transport system ATP-binding protein